VIDVSLGHGPRYSIPKSVTVVHHGPDVVEFRLGVWHARSHVMRDGARQGQLSRVVRLLDGTRTVSQIAIAASVPQEVVVAVLGQLRLEGLLQESGSQSLDELLGILYLSPPQATGNLAPVKVIGDGLADRVAALLRDTTPDLSVSVDSSAAERLAGLAADDSWLDDDLELMRVLEPFSSWAGCHVILAEEVIDPHRARGLNRAALEYGFQCLYVALDGPFVLVGPTVVPGRSACWECFESRVVMNLRDHATYVRYKDALADSRNRVDVGRSGLPVITSLAASIAAAECLSFLVTGGASTLNQMWSFFLPTMELAIHKVLRVPGCPACGSVERQESHLSFDLRTLEGNETS